MVLIKGKERRAELATSIRRANDNSALAIKELLGLLIASAKDNLVHSSGDDTLRLQGEAQALQRLYESITREPPAIGRKEGINS